MKLYAPKYYQNFKCIADRCEHSCCIGWEIDIDADTYEKYKTLKGAYGSVIAQSISTEDTPHFKLEKGDRCPHLDQRGLCKIILHEGEDCLCQICREHPRFYNYTKVAEVGIGMSCMEAARVVLTSPDYGTMVEMGDVDALFDDVDFDGAAERRRLYEILQHDGLDYSARLAEIRREYGLCVGDDEIWLKSISALEYLNEDHKTLFMQYASQRCPTGKDAYRERALAYFIYRHCTEAMDMENFCIRLGFCMFCERLLTSLIVARGADTLQEIAELASIISEEIEYSDDNTAALMEQAAELM